MNIFEKNIVALYGNQGHEWLKELPTLIEEFSQKWDLSILYPVDNLSYHYVLKGFQNEQLIILKLGLTLQRLEQEAAALQAFNGHGTIKLLAHHEGALLLERAIPGTSLKDFFPNQDKEAIAITCQLISRLHRIPLPTSHSFPHIKDWLQLLYKEWDIPSNYLAKARELAYYLLETSCAEVFLHGDLHHENILRDKQEWKAIDPHGVIGDATYEVGAFIRNPLPQILAHPDLKKLLEERVLLFAELLPFQPQRIAQWCFVQSVLAYIWSLQDNLSDPSFLDLIKILDELA